MPKYMIQASFSKDGAEALRRAGGAARREAAREAIESVGGKLEAYYFTFGDSDAMAIAELPDGASAAAAALVVGASGVGSTRTTPLLTVEEMDAAMKKDVKYHPP